MTKDPANLSSAYENDTNLGSLGNPSGPILFFANLCSVYTLLASSKLIPLVFINRWTSRLPLASSPALESPSVTFELRSNADELKPASTSPMNEVGSRE